VTNAVASIEAEIARREQRAHHAGSRDRHT